MSRHPSLPLLTNSRSSEGARRQSGDIYFLGLFKARRDLCYPSPAIISRCRSCAGLRLFSLLNRTEQRVWGDDLLEIHPGRDGAAGYCCLWDPASAGAWKVVHSTSGSLLPHCFPVPAQLWPYTPGLCPALLPPLCSASRLCQNPAWFGTGCCPSRGVADVSALQPALQTACCSHTAATSLAILDLHYK